MSDSRYWVRLRHEDRIVGAGFFVTSRWILTAAHCLRSVPDDVDRLVVLDPSGCEISARVVERNSKVDLALLEAPGGIPRTDTPAADYCVSGDSWQSPYRPKPTEPALTGQVARHDIEYQCEGGDVVNALQLRTTVELGDYSGYSGAPVERLAYTGEPALVGILLEQYPDRVDTERATNVLFAGAIGNALANFDQFSVGHLMRVLTSDEADSAREPETSDLGPTTTGSAMAEADAKFEFLARCAERGYLDAEELRVLRLKVITGVIDTELT